MKKENSIIASLLCAAIVSLTCSCSKNDVEENQPKTRGFTDGYEWVDLNLPSGTLWATCNVGAYSAYDAGKFFQYGNPTPFSFLNESQLPTTDIGGTSKDPVYVHMGDKWRLPTQSEMQELVGNCTWQVVMNGYSRYYVGTSQRNGSKIYFPAAGAYPLGSTNNSILYENEQCWLMTSTLDDSTNPRPYILKIQYLSSSNSSIDVTANEAWRHSSMPVRGVTAKAKTTSKTISELLIGTWRMYDEKDMRWYSSIRFEQDGTGVFVEKWTPDDMTWSFDPETMNITIFVPDWDDSFICHVVYADEKKLYLETYYGSEPESEKYYRWSGGFPPDHKEYPAPTEL